MSHVITVENLGKKYLLSHKARQESYVALRDVLSEGVRKLGRRILGAPGAAEYSAEMEEFWALRDVSFQVKQGDRIGIIGCNGAGKSTLLKILSRITQPSTGSIRLKGRVASLLEVGTGFHPELTGRENIFLNGAILGMGRSEICRKFDEIVDFAEVEKFLDTPVKHYSSGMYVRLAFAVAAHLEPEILVVDEVLAVGDAQFQKKCLGKMEAVSSKEGRTVLFVSHNMVAVRALCNKAILLEKGKVVLSGPVEDTIIRHLSATARGVSFQWACNAPESAPGNDFIRLRRVALVAKDGAPSETISVLSPFEIAIEFWNLKPDAHLSLSMHLVTQEEVIAFASTTWQEEEWHGKPFGTGVYQSICAIPGGLLNVGPYRIRLFFLDKLKALCRIEECLVFELRDSVHDRGEWHGKWDGVVRPTLDWATKKLE